jgi:hypothetical protein
MPKRIQRKRTKGWRMPPNTVSVTRPGPFGNPYKGPGAVAAFRELIEQMQKAMREEGGLLPVIGPDYEVCDLGADLQEFAYRLVRRLPELRGKNLACFCSLENHCHADVLLELANQEPDSPQASRRKIPAGS